MRRNAAEELKKKPKRKKSSNHFDWKDLWQNNHHNHPDIWFDSNNRPQSAEECKHLRQAIENQRRA